MIVDIYFWLSVCVSAVLTATLAADRGFTTVLLFLGLSAALFVAVVLLHLIFCFAISAFTDLSKPCRERKPLYRKILAVTAAGVLRLSRVRVHISGEELPAGRFLLVSNHLSNFDPIVCIDKFRKHEIAFVSKPENFRIPILGKFVHNCNYLPIDRENARNAMRTINDAAELIKDDVCSIGIYPEGTRSKTGELGPFHDGVFRIAYKSKVPVAVVTVRGTESIAKNYPFKHTDVYMDVVQVIPYEDYSEERYGEFGERVRGIMLESLNKTHRQQMG